jgi:hypothetical protein
MRKYLEETLNMDEILNNSILDDDDKCDFFVHLLMPPRIVRDIPRSLNRVIIYERQYAYNKNQQSSI